MHRSEIHPLEPFLPENAKVLILGSFPPPKAKWKMDFYYPNFQNDMWRIFGEVFFGDMNYFLTADKKLFDKEKLIGFLAEKGIAVSDTAHEVIRLKGNASDSSLEVLKPMDLQSVLQKIPHCRVMVTTGEKATEILRSLLPDLTSAPKIGTFVETEIYNKKLAFYRLPSSSRAYPKPLIEKAKIYGSFFKEIGLL